MGDLGIILGTALILPLLLWLVAGFALPAIMGLKEITKKDEPMWARALILVQVVLFGGTAILFAVSPIANHGTSGLIGVVLGAVVWYLFLRDKTPKPKDSAE